MVVRRRLARPWVLVGSLAAVTTRLRFLTSIYVPAIRSPFQVAKSVAPPWCSRATGSPLGVGVGWCREEFGSSARTSAPAVGGPTRRSR